MGMGFGARNETTVEWSQVQRESSVSRPGRTNLDETSRRTSAVIRTCIGCRKRELAADLLRIVARAVDGTSTVTIVPDPQRRLMGRGAWLHPHSVCLRGAVRRRAIGRALRVSGNLDISALEHHLENRHEHS